MKKIFTLVCGLLGIASAVNAATVDDLALLKHSYVLTCDDLGARPGKGVLFGNDHFLDVTGGSVATNKGSVDLSQPGATTYTYKDGDGNDVVEDIPQYITDDIIAKYGADYGGSHYNWLRLKNAQDVIAMKLTAGTKVIMYLQGNNKIGKDARIPKIATDAKLENALNAAPDENHPRTVSGYRWEYTVNDDGVYYFGSYNGDMFVSFIIIEANEAPGTPAVKVGAQTYADGLWYREVSCSARDFTMEGSEEKIPTIVTYTTDGSAPTATSDVYSGPIKCYKDMVVKFQAYQDWNMGAMEGFICPNADNEAAVSFSFDAPILNVDGATFSISNATEGAENYYSYGEVVDQKGDGATLTESATVTAYSKIVNGNYATFVTKSVSKDVLVLNPIKEDKVIKVIAGDVVVDEEATANATDGQTVYVIQNGAISADKMDFFVKNLCFGVVTDPAYQIDGDERYIKMSDTNISFLVADGDSIDVKVTCSKNSCKQLPADGKTTDLKCYVNIDGTTYGHDDVTAEGGNVITFGLNQGVHTFLKYSGTGNILISSIEIKYIGTAAIREISAEKKFNAKKVFKNNQFIIETSKGNFNAAGLRVK